MHNRTHIASLDGLRGLAASAVVISHITEIYPAFPMPVAHEIGGNAVALFFALSGFLMTVLYASRPFDLHEVSSFIVNRFARIYPVYLAAVLFVTVLSFIPAVGYYQPITNPTQIFRHVAMMGSTGVFWSIPPEIQFYLAFPLIWMCMSQPARFQTVILLLLGMLALLALTGFPGPGILLLSKLHFFLAGVVAGHFHRQSTHGAPGAVHGALALGLTVMLLCYQTLFPQFVSATWGLPTALAVMLIMLTTAREHRLSAAVFASRPLRFLGDISFSVYLFHVPVMFLVGEALGPMLPLAVVRSEERRVGKEC